METLSGTVNLGAIEGRGSWEFIVRTSCLLWLVVFGDVIVLVSVWKFRSLQKLGIGKRDATNIERCGLCSSAFTFTLGGY